MRLVLCEDQDLSDTGVQAVGQGEVDDPVFSAKWDGWLCTKLSQWL